MRVSDIELKPHQISPVKMLKKQRGLILFHSTGSGKTITALVSMMQFDKEIIIIGPRSSQKAFNDDIKKLKMNDDNISFYTYTKIKKLVNDNHDILDGKCVILDEAHNIRNETANNLRLIFALEFSYKILLLTATPIINYPNELSVLINIINNKHILPTDRKTFTSGYYDTINKTIKNKDTLLKKLKNCISYYDHREDSKYYPSSTTKYLEVNMNDEQLEEYKYYIKKFLIDEVMGSNIYNIDFENINIRKKNFFLSGTRQLSNTIDGNHTFPKIQSMYKLIKKGKFPCIIYSNYLKNGVMSLVPLFEKSNLTYQVITGNTNNDKINQVVNSYNRGKYDILMLTSAGSESLDLKNTRQIHIMEPHWNESRITQVIGRAIRYKSHYALPNDERNVKIYRWISVFPTKINNISADQHLMEISKSKHEILESIIEVIKEGSIENQTYSQHTQQKQQKQQKQQRQRKQKYTKHIRQMFGGYSYISLYTSNKSKYISLSQQTRKHLWL